MTEAVMVAMPPPARAVPLLQGLGVQPVTSVPALLLGWSVQETTGTTTELAVFYDGTVLSGRIAAAIRVAANTSSTVWLGPNGVLCGSGVTVTVNSAGLAGAVWVVML